MWLRDLRIVLPDRTLQRGSLRLEHGRIAEIIEDAPSGSREPVPPLTALPGSIDLYTDALRHELQPVPEYATDLVRLIDGALYELDKRLAAAGVTTAYLTLPFHAREMPDPLYSKSIVRDIITRLHTLRRDLLVALCVHACFDVSTPAIVPFLVEMLTTRRLHMVSLTDQRADALANQGYYRLVDTFVNFVARQRSNGYMSHDEELARFAHTAPDLAHNWERARGVVGIATRQRLPIGSCADQSRDKVDLTASLGASLCMFPATLAAAQHARQQGLYVALGASALLAQARHVPQMNGLDGWAALRAGVVDILVSEHDPANLLQCAFMLVQNHAMPLHEAVRLISFNPAEALGLYDRGGIVVGKRADIILIDTTTEIPHVRCTLHGGVPISCDGSLAQVSVL